MWAKIRFLKVHLIWRTVAPYARGSVLRNSRIRQKLVEYLDPSTQVYGRTRQGTSPVLKEQVRKLKERHPWVNIMIIPEPCQGKSALSLVELSVQREH